MASREELEAMLCKRCGETVKSYSPMRKWCFDCRKEVSLEQAKARKISDL